MNCYGGTDLARAYRTVRDNTIKIAEEIPESKVAEWKFIKEILARR